MRNARTAILIPCFNEERTIQSVVRSFRATLPDAEIYVYDNNSTDATASLAAQSGAIVRQEPRQGKGNVIRSMFREIDAGCYVLIDGDDTYPAEAAPEMVRRVLSGKADMVLGDRLSSTYASENKRRFHGFGNHLVRTLVNRLFHGQITDIMTGYRAFSRDFVKSFPVLSRGFEIETEMTIHALDKNFVIQSIPVAYRDRPSGSVSKLDTFSDGFRVLRMIVRMLKDYRPFFFFGLSALACWIVSALLLVPVLTEYFKTGFVPRFPTLIVSGILATSGLLLFVCGLVLDTVAQKHRELFEFQLTVLRQFRGEN